MLARNELIFKWSLYAAGALLCLSVQCALLQRLTVWGVIPFLFPLIAAVPATFEAPAAAALFSMGVGVVCDLLLPGTPPAFYTLVFPLAGLCAAQLSRSILRPGVICSAVCGVVAFFLTDLLHILVLAFAGEAVFPTAAAIFLRETLVSLPAVLPMTALFRRIYQRTHIYD